MELAQSKYIMGPNKITRYQYDKRMQATTRFKWLEAETTTEAKWQMTLNNTPDESNESSKDKPHSSGPIRKRGPRLTDSMPEPTEFSASDFQEKSQEHEEGVQLTSFISATESAAKQARRDPVNWFGVLTPAPLRHAQSSFQQALLELTACVNLKARMDEVHARLLALQAKKNVDSEA